MGGVGKMFMEFHHSEAFVHASEAHDDTIAETV